MNLNSISADLVVFVHAAYVTFVIFGLVATLAGVVLHWKWIRNFWFRSIHLSMIGIVVFEALVGITCPLTTLEHRLRLAAGQQSSSGSFVGRWMHELLFFEAPPWVFTVVYCVFGAIVLATFALAPPRWSRMKQVAAES